VIRHLFLGYRGLSRPASVFSMMMMMMMGSHSVTCRPTQVNTLLLNLSQTGRYSIYLP